MLPAQRIAPTLDAVYGFLPAYRIEPLAGQASARQYYRIHVELPDPRNAPTPPTVVAMAMDSALPEEATSASAPTLAAELPFLNVQRQLIQRRVDVPAVYHADAVNRVILLEDLGDQTLEQTYRAAGDADRRRLYLAAIDDLVGMQRAMGVAAASECVAFERHFTADLLRWELDHFREFLLEADRGARLSPSESSDLDGLFDALADELCKLPKAFVHRDYQSRNIMVQASNATSNAPARLRIIDFQDALVGPYVYDLVALLRDSYIALPAPFVDEAVAHFAAAIGRPASEVRRHFDLQTVQRKLKDAGRFVFIDRVKANPSFLPYIPESLAYVGQALARLPELDRLSRLLGSYVSELETIPTSPTTQRPNAT